MIVRTRRDLKIWAHRFGQIENFGPHLILRSGKKAVYLWDDGTLSRADVDLTVTTKMRVRDAAKYLGAETL